VDVYAKRVSEEQRLQNVRENCWLTPWDAEDTYPYSFQDQLLFGRRTVKLLTRINKLANYEVVISELLASAWDGILASGLKGSGLSILDEHNVEWKLQHQISGAGKHSWRALKLYERACCNRFDYVAVPSPVDKTGLQELGVEQEKILIVPNGVDTEVFRGDPNLGTAVREKHGLGERPIIMYMGYFGYYPNVDAASIMIDRISPRVDGDAVFMITGAKSENLPIPKGDRFLVTGPVSELNSYINAADLCIAPVRFGSGTRLKLIEWMACEKPVVASSKAAEGLDVEDGVNIIIEDNFSKYPHLISQLLSDSGLRSKLGRKAGELVRSKYQWSTCLEPLVSTIKTHLEYSSH
jgi:glycosyltransferase involved in cell wall biosynthesis